MLSAHQTVTLWLLRCLLIFLPWLTWCLAIKVRKKSHDLDDNSTISPVPVLRNMVNQKIQLQMRECHIPPLGLHQNLFAGHQALCREKAQQSGPVSITKVGREVF